MKVNENKIRVRLMQLIGLEVAAIAFSLMLVAANKGGMQ